MVLNSEPRRDRKDIAAGLTRADVEMAMNEWRESGENAFHRRFGTRAAAKFLVLDADGRRYDAKAILFGARRMRGLDGDNGDFDGDRVTVAEPLVALGFPVVEKPTVSGPTPSIESEVQRRRDMWEALQTSTGGSRIAPTSTVNQLRIFLGGRGVWYDSEMTRPYVVPGVTVGVLHTGQHYADELTPEGIVYHYPRTKSPNRDASEVAATKNACSLSVPVFVVIKSGMSRRVHLGWVLDWNDAAAEFWIQFGEEKPASILPAIEDEGSAFEAFHPRPRATRRLTKVRSGQAKFSFSVRKRAGAVCGACALSVPDLIDAAHVIPDAAGGSNDPRNGLPLCATHHRAFDANLIGIDPETMRWVTAPTGQFDLASLGVTKPDLEHLLAKPHAEALEWRWNRLVSRWGFGPDETQPAFDFDDPTHSAPQDG